MNAYPRTLSDQVAERIVRLRKRRGWTRDQLASRCDVLGYSWLTGPALANIETGRRNTDGSRRRHVTVEELSAFAHVLGVETSGLFAATACKTCDGFPEPGFTCRECGLSVDEADD